jgi:hypothetical protein
MGENGSVFESVSKFHGLLRAGVPKPLSAESKEVPAKERRVYYAGNPAGVLFKDAMRP